MKFETKDGLKFEVSNLTHIVINNVIRVITPAGKGKPARVTTKTERDPNNPLTRVWWAFQTAKGSRWAKYQYDGPIPEVDDMAQADAYQSQDQCQQLLEDTMRRPDCRLWFSGTYCNIEITSNYQEVKRIQAREEARKRKKGSRPFLHDDLVDAIRYGIQEAGAQVRKEALETPFGLIPVMAIRGSGRRRQA